MTDKEEGRFKVGDRVIYNDPNSLIGLYIPMTVPAHDIVHCTIIQEFKNPNGGMRYTLRGDNNNMYHGVEEVKLMPSDKLVQASRVKLKTKCRLCESKARKAEKKKEKEEGYVGPKIGF